MSNNPNLWWSYDSESGSFTALPASPFLLPAMAIMGVLSLLGVGRVRIGYNGDKLGEFGKSAEYLACLKRYDELRDKRIEYGELDPDECREMYQLQFPKWNNGKYWEY